VQQEFEVSIFGVGWRIDDLIDRQVAGVEGKRLDRLALRSEIFCDSLHITTAEDHGAVVVDRIVIRRDIEFGCVNRDATGFETGQRVVDKLFAQGQRPKMH
tara:strand:+ start:574 stop:876 length:303 start_codon:yes stop_codon:yes gene_type:complete